MSSRFTMRDPTIFKLWIVYFWKKILGESTYIYDEISQNHPKNLWTSMDQNHGHMPILYKMVRKKVQHIVCIKVFFFKSKQSIVWILLGHAWWIGWTFANRWLGIQYSAKSFWFGTCLWFIYIYIYIDVWIIGIHMFQNTSTTYSIYQSSPIYMTHWKQ